MRKSPRRLEALVKTGSFGYFLACLACIHLFSPSQLMYSAPKEMMICFGFCFAIEVGYLQIAQVQESSYEALNCYNFSVLTALSVNTFAHAWGFTVVNEYQLLIVLCVASAVCYLHLIINSCNEITAVLQIPVFAMPKKNKKT